MIRAERTGRPAPASDARRASPRRPGCRLGALLASLLTAALALAAPPLGAASPPSSWQRQTLLAATEDEYLVLETEGHKPGSVDVWTETVRFVRFDARSNARGEVELVRVETWSPAGDGTRRTDVTRSSDASLGAALDAFGGRLAPPPAIRLKREFRVDADGIHVFDADAGVRVPVLTREGDRRPRPPRPARGGLRRDRGHRPPADRRAVLPDPPRGGPAGAPRAGAAHSALRAVPRLGPPAPSRRPAPRARSPARRVPSMRSRADDG